MAGTRKDLAVILLTLALLSVACTTSLTHDRVSLTESQKEPGLPYYLPKQVYTVAITYELSGCPDTNSADRAKQTEELAIQQTATVVEASVADEEESYILTYRDLDSTMKTSSFNATVYPNKTIHTIGAQVEDKTAAIIKSTVGTAISVAKMAMGIPTEATTPSLCRPDVYEAIKAARALKTKLYDPNADDKTKSAASAALTTARSTLQIQKQIDFVPAWGKLSGDITLSERDLTKWFVALTPYLATAKEPAKADLKRLTRSTVRVTPDTTKPPALFVAKNLKAGVVFRDPAPRLVEVCTGVCSAGEDDILAHLATNIAQLGRYMVIELENGPFAKNNVSLSFAANGTLESMTYATESSLEKAAGALADTATQAASFLDKKQAADKAKQEAEAGAELKAIKAKTDLLNAKADQIQAQHRLQSLGGQ